MEEEEEATGEEEGAGDAASSPPAQNSYLRLHGALGLDWVLKVCLRLAELTHLAQGHDDWGPAANRSVDRGDRWGPWAGLLRGGALGPHRGTPPAQPVPCQPHLDSWRCLGLLCSVT